MSEIEIRPAGPGDLIGILETLRLALGESPLLRRTPELWSWKHDSNPFGESIVLVAASRQGTIAGVRALMRWELVDDGQGIIRCSRAVDTATHPDFIRQGIFRDLTMSAIEIAKEDHVHLVFNTPNEKSAPGYLKMGWKPVGDIGVQVRPRVGATVDHDPGDAPRIDTWAPGSLSTANLPIVGQSVSPRLRTRLTPEYLEWRYEKHPYASYGWIPGTRGGGLVVRASLRNGRPEMVACDLLGVPDSSAIRHAARISRARYMAGWFSPGTPRRRAALMGGLLPVPGIRTLQLVALPLADLTLDPHALGSWDLSTSDLELL